MTDKKKKLNFLKSRTFHAGSSSLTNGAVVALAKLGLLGTASGIAFPIGLVAGGFSLGLLISILSEKKKLSKKERDEFIGIVQEGIRLSTPQVSPRHNNEPFNDPLQDDFIVSPITLHEPDYVPSERITEITTSTKEYDDSSEPPDTHRTVIIDGEEFEIRF